MQLKPVDSPELIRLVAGWLSEKENYQWLDFGDGRQTLSAEWLKIAMQRGTQVIRVFTADDTRHPDRRRGIQQREPALQDGNLLGRARRQVAGGPRLRQPRDVTHADARLHRARPQGHPDLDRRAQSVRSGRRAGQVQSRSAGSGSAM